MRSLRIRRCTMAGWRQKSWDIECMLCGVFIPASPTWLWAMHLAHRHLEESHPPKETK